MWQPCKKVPAFLFNCLCFACPVCRWCSSTDLHRGSDGVHSWLEWSWSQEQLIEPKGSSLLLGTSGLCPWVGFLTALYCNAIQKGGGKVVDTTGQCQAVSNSIHNLLLIHSDLSRAAFQIIWWAFRGRTLIQKSCTLSKMTAVWGPWIFGIILYDICTPWVKRI